MEDSNQKSGNNIDARDEDRGDRIPLIEAGRPVHCAVEFRLARDLLAPFPCLMFVDQPGIQIGIDRHLFSGHCVQCEPGGYFCRAHRSMADHDVLNCD